MGCTTPPGQLEGGCTRSHPSVTAAGKTCLMQNSRGFGHGVAVSGLQDLLQMQWLCSQLCYGMWLLHENCRDWAFSISGLEVGLPALQLQSLAKWDALPNWDLSSTCLLKKSIPAIPFRNSKHPLPGRSNFLTAAARSTLFALGLQKIPSLRCSCKKRLSYAEKQSVWSWSRGLQDVLQCSDCALSCAIWPLQTINNYRDWAFSSSGLEVGAASLPAAEFGKRRRTAERRFKIDMFV